MGYNSVAVILNDATHAIAEDLGFGARVADAIRGYTRRDRSRLAAEASAINRSPGGGVGIHCGALTIIGQDHADHYQTIVAGRNTGWSLDRDKDIPPSALEAVAIALRNHGYRVTKPKRPAGD